MLTSSPPSLFRPFFAHSLFHLSPPQRLRKRHLKGEFALLQTLSPLFQLIQFVKCWHVFLDLNSKRLYQSSGKEKESRCLLFTSSTKREIRYFHIVVVHRRQRNKRDASAKLLFCQSKPIAFLLFSLPSPSSLPKLSNVILSRSLCGGESSQFAAFSAGYFP